jgi:hypothetical protein
MAIGLLSPSGALSHFRRATSLRRPLGLRHPRQDARLAADPSPPRRPAGARCAVGPSLRDGGGNLLRLGRPPEEERPPFVYRAGGYGFLMPGNPALSIGPGRQAGDGDWRLRLGEGHLDLKGAVVTGNDLVGGAGVWVRLDHGAAYANGG